MLAFFEPGSNAELCAAHDVFLIADEVMTGWGRTGTRFACEQAGVVPDLMCLSKGMTGGFLPLAATLATAEIYDSFYSTDRSRTFWHSSSFTGNPICTDAMMTPSSPMIVSSPTPPLIVSSPNLRSCVSVSPSTSCSTRL